jgi:cytochrome c-type biogenesis protein
MFGFSLPLVFGAGVLSFLSPCVLPLVPPYLTYMGGATLELLRGDDRALRARIVFTTVVFILGFSAVFVTLGATATAFGQQFRQALPVLTPLAGVLIFAMGLHFLGVFRLAFLDREVRHRGPGIASGPVGGFLLGLAFAIGWTPCIGPILAAILSVAANENSALEGAALLGVYSLGLGVPFLLAGIAVGPFLAFFGRFKRNLGLVEKIVGVLLVLTGIMFLTGNFTRLSYWFLETFPLLGRLG